MLRLPVYIILTAILVSAASCGRKSADAEKDVIAGYNGKYLYKDDIPQEVWEAHLKGDSSGLLKSMVDKWLETQVMVAEAEKILSDDSRNRKKLIEDYRNSLLIYAYQQQLIREKLDTGVTEQEIAAFYQENKAAFQLKKNIVKIRYVKIMKQKADLNRLRKLMQDPTPQNDAKLKEYAEGVAENFYLDSNWLYLDDITKEIPLNENYNQQRFLSNNKFIQIEENNILYLLYIIDFRIKDAVSPIEFEKEKIRDIILYQRKLKFLKEIQTSLYRKAVESGDIKYNLPQK